MLAWSLVCVKLVDVLESKVILVNGDIVDGLYYGCDHWVVTICLPLLSTEQSNYHACRSGCWVAGSNLIVIYN